jgi:hypothetical protein
LTEEEKKQKLAELREKMAAKRATKAVEEAKEAKANETLRRKTGKVGLIDIFCDSNSSAARTWARSKKKWKRGKL